MSSLLITEKDASKLADLLQQVNIDAAVSTEQTSQHIFTITLRGRELDLSALFRSNCQINRLETKRTGDSVKVSIVILV